MTRRTIAEFGRDRHWSDLPHGYRCSYCHSLNIARRVMLSPEQYDEVQRFRFFCSVIYEAKYGTGHIARRDIIGLTHISDKMDKLLDMRIMPPYQVRFIPAEDIGKIVQLYHLARTALSGKTHAEQSPYHRMLWASKQYALAHPSISETAAYKDLSGLLDR